MGAVTVTPINNADPFDPAVLEGNFNNVGAAINDGLESTNNFATAGDLTYRTVHKGAGVEIWRRSSDEPTSFPILYAATPGDPHQLESFTNRYSVPDASVRCHIRQSLSRVRIRAWCSIHAVKDTWLTAVQFATIPATFSLIVNGTSVRTGVNAIVSINGRENRGVSCHLDYLFAPGAATVTLDVNLDLSFGAPNTSGSTPRTSHAISLSRGIYVEVVYK